MCSHINWFQHREAKTLFAGRSLTERSRALGAGFGRWVVLFLLLAVWPAAAQEALQNMQAGQSAAESRTKQMQNQDYTFKKGDFRLLVTPSMAAQWNDNVNLSDTNQMDDYILTPAVGIVSSYPLTQRNILFLDVSIGYDRYLNHPSLSTFDINSSSGTGVSFDIGIKDVTLNLHDWFSYSQNVTQNSNTGSAAQNGTIANSDNYGTFQNTAGLSALWDLNQVTLSAGYDHQNVIATSGQYDNVNHASELFFLRSGFQVHPQVNVGVETTATLTRYSGNGASSGNQLNDNDAYTVGPYVTFRPGQYIQLTARGGYTTYQFQQTSSTIQTSSQDSWYAGLTFSHQPTEAISYSLTAGRDVALGTQSDLTEDWYVRPNITWNVIKDWSLNTGMFYQHGTQGTGNVSGNFSENYDWYGGSVGLSHALNSRFTLGLNYRLTFRSSDQPNNGYTQNLVGLQLTYHPK